MATSDNELVEQAKVVISNHEDNCRRCDLEAVMTNVSDDVVVLVSRSVTPLQTRTSAFRRWEKSGCGYGP